MKTANSEAVSHHRSSRRQIALWVFSKMKWQFFLLTRKTKKKGNTGEEITVYCIIYHDNRNLRKHLDSRKRGKCCK